MVEVLDSEDGLRLGPMWVGEEEDFPDAGHMVPVGAHLMPTRMGTMHTHTAQTRTVRTHMVDTRMVHLRMNGGILMDFLQLLMSMGWITLRTSRCTPDIRKPQIHGGTLTVPHKDLR